MNRAIGGVVALAIVAVLVYIVFTNPFAPVPDSGNQTNVTIPSSSLQSDEDVGNAIDDIGSGIRDLSSTIRELDEKIY